MTLKVETRVLLVSEDSEMFRQAVIKQVNSNPNPTFVISIMIIFKCFEI